MDRPPLNNTKITKIVNVKNAISYELFFQDRILQSLSRTKGIAINYIALLHNFFITFLPTWFRINILYIICIYYYIIRRFHMSIFYKSAYNGKPIATERHIKVSVLIRSRWKKLIRKSYPVKWQRCMNLLSLFIYAWVYWKGLKLNSCSKLYLNSCLIKN